MQKNNHMASVERYTIVVCLSTKDSGAMVVCQAMADKSILMLTMLETLKITDIMAKEHMSMMMAEPMWVPGKTAWPMVRAK